MLVSQTKEKQASTLSEVTWKGRTLSVKHEKVSFFYLFFFWGTLFSRKFYLKNFNIKKSSF